MRVRKPDLMKKIEGEAFERHYLGFEPIIKNAEEKAEENGIESVKGPDRVIAEKNVYGNFVADQGLRTRIVLEEMKENEKNQENEILNEKFERKKKILGSDEGKENIDTDRVPINSENI